MSTYSLTHLRQLEAESIHIIREVAAEFENPVMLYSIGKDSVGHAPPRAEGVLSRRRCRSRCLHVDTHVEVPEMIAFRDAFAKEHGLELIVHTNQEGVDAGHQPDRRTAARSYTDVMKTAGAASRRSTLASSTPRSAARAATRRSRAPRSASTRSATSSTQWDPKNQRPELWNLYNGQVNKGESIRVFPLSNWTELDVWQYVHLENIPIVPLYFASRGRSSSATAR